MCTRCGNDSGHHSLGVQRRNFLKLASIAALNFGVLGRSQATEMRAVSKQSDVLTPDAGLQRLMKGNRRYVEGKMRRDDFVSERAALALER